MRKKISLLLCVIAVMLCFTACKSSEDAVEYDKAIIEQTAEFIIEYCSNTDEATLEKWKNMREFPMELQMVQAGLPVTPKSFLGAIDTWKAAIDECGAYEGHDEYTFEEMKDGVKLSASAQFAGRDATISFKFDEKSYLESMSVDAEFTIAEILKKSGLNTILGMGTVFAVLIFISFLISLLQYIPALLGVDKKKPEAVASVPVKSAPVIVPEVSDTDDTELIAVIAAAIAAAREEAGSEEAGTGGFFVRSIRRRPSNKWNS